jgi:tetratricopeptide (TPR) repeat protein
MIRGASTDNIFISYRREDSAAYAGRISDHLTSLFGASRVFMDVDDIRPGENFAQAIDQTIAACRAVLVIIGPRWMEILRKRSEEHQPDYVCHEIEAALTRKTLLIPVLVGSASMTQLTDLPPSLTELPLHEAIEIRDSTFKDDCARLASALGPPSNVRAPRKKLAGWMGASAVIIVLLAALSIWVGVGPWNNYHQRKVRIEQILNTARTQTEQGEFESAFRSYQDALKLGPGESPVMDRQLDTAMLWVENFHIVVGEGQKAEDLAGPVLGEIMSTLEAGLARAKGRASRAADIMAHLGWAHWLNQHIAFKEFGSAAEQALRKALTLDPSNVYANAMLGNWLLQTDGSVDEALRSFDVAVKTGKQRPLVRSMQLGGMIYNEAHGVQTELIRVANQMRINSEPIEGPESHRILANYSLTNSEEELRETLSAVPPDDAWATFLWLNKNQSSGAVRKDDKFQNDFIRADILDIAGRRDEALAMFRKLQKDVNLLGYSQRIVNRVDVAVKRLSQTPETKH